MNSSAIDSLYRDLGTYGAEDIICRAMEDLGQRLLMIADLAQKGAREDLYKALRALGAVADQVGLSGMAGIARDVMVCIEDGDPIAEAATLARLARAGEASLTELGDPRGLSI